MPEIPHQDFDAIEVSHEVSATFDLAGRQWRCRSADEVPFSLLAMFVDTDESDGRAAIAQVEPFFASTLVPDDVEAFLAMLKAPESAMTVPKLQPVMQFVIEAVLGRPTERSSPSSAGSPTTEGISQDGSSSPDTADQPA